MAGALNQFSIYFVVFDKKLHRMMSRTRGVLLYATAALLSQGGKCGASSSSTPLIASAEQSTAGGVENAGSWVWRPEDASSCLDVREALNLPAVAAPSNLAAGANIVSVAESEPNLSVLVEAIKVCRSHALFATNERPFFLSPLRPLPF